MKPLLNFQINCNASCHATCVDIFALSQFLARAAYGQHFAAARGGGVPIDRSLRDAAAAAATRARLRDRRGRGRRPSIHL